MIHLLSHNSCSCDFSFTNDSFILTCDFYTIHLSILLFLQMIHSLLYFFTRLFHSYIHLIYKWSVCFHLIHLFFTWFFYLLNYCANDWFTFTWVMSHLFYMWPFLLYIWFFYTLFLRDCQMIHLFGMIDSVWRSNMLKSTSHVIIDC